MTKQYDLFYEANNYGVRSTWIATFTFLTSKSWLTFANKTVTVYHTMTIVLTLNLRISKCNSNITSNLCFTGLGVHGSQSSHLAPVKPGGHLHMKPVPI